MPESLKLGLWTFRVQVFAYTRSNQPSAKQTPCSLDSRPSNSTCFGQGLFLFRPSPSLPICTVAGKAQPRNNWAFGRQLKAEERAAQVPPCQGLGQINALVLVRRCCPEMDASCSHRCLLCSCCSSLLLLLMVLSVGMHVRLTTTVMQKLPLLL